MFFMNYVKIQINMKGISQYRDAELPNYTDIDNLTEERANELCNMLNNGDLTLKELRKMKLKGQI